MLNRKWTLMRPDTKVHQIMVSEGQIEHQGGPFGNILFSNNPHPFLSERMMEKNHNQTSFYVVRDDLLHPLVNGNKARKLDGLFPLVQDHSVINLLWLNPVNYMQFTVSCTERGLKSHLLLRGEQPEILTGYNQISTLYGNVTYVPRSLYTKREEMLTRHAHLIAGNCGSVLLLNDLFESSFTNNSSGEPNSPQMDGHRGSYATKKVVIVNEGAGDAVGLLGVIGLVQYLSQSHLLGKEQACKIVVDAGTGTTAVGLVLAAICLGLPWEVTAVMLADTIDGYKRLEERLISQFCGFPVFSLSDQVLVRARGGIVCWVNRRHPRKFGNALKGEVEACLQVAQQTSVLVDPMYTLAAWELAIKLSQEEADGGAKVVMVHTGGTLGMFGLAQRYKSFFQMLNNGPA
ncbi:hypothetical protein RJ639_042559 [Escallonia herrerae]|uniref:D-cysteine desulfhydrase 2, mitochondrial n=1 Tax=Escallonia herrerae TaxID=1293975 RepID=A0AA88WEC8_9ASTE|nr:hypothetical protein RJ639_042559 [Escallonia herrerae]